MTKATVDSPARPGLYRIAALRALKRWTQEELARRLGVATQTVYRWEAGRRGPDEDTLVKLAEVFGCAIGELFTDLGPIHAPLSGSIGAGQRVELNQGPDATGEPWPCPPGMIRPIAMIVRGDSMLPAYRDGDVVIIDAPDGYGVPEDAIGRDCVVALEDGTHLVKTVLPGRDPGTFHLTSYGAHETLTNKALRWAAPVRWVQRS